MDSDGFELVTAKKGRPRRRNVLKPSELSLSVIENDVTVDAKLFVR
jgi:hypothetical protein